MYYDSLDAFLKSADTTLKKGPVGMIFVEDDIEVGSTVRHHLDSGFKQLLVLMPDAFDLPEDVVDKVARIDFDIAKGGLCRRDQPYRRRRAGALDVLLL